ncbi:hypothetical protein TNCV_2536331 [Trichonephila clavipes]|nr:hypothetical protein TNCV_2536331 [Trichonephila clavipes]
MCGPPQFSKFLRGRPTNLDWAPLDYMLLTTETCGGYGYGSAGLLRQFFKGRQRRTGHGSSNCAITRIVSLSPRDDIPEIQTLRQL